MTVTNAALIALVGLAAAVAPEPTGRPLIIGHRGAAGHRPEHTLEGYRLAAQMGADFIEPDLVSTRDGVLIARHENEIGGTTDVAERYPDRKRAKTIDGTAVTGWFTEDFTLAEIRTLKARERLPFRSHAFDGQFGVPTFDEVIALAQQLGRELGRPIGVYPETKHPTYFRGLGLALEPKLLEALERHGWNRRDAPVYIQSFETGNLRDLRRTTAVRLIQLLDDSGVPWDRHETGHPTYAEMTTDAGLETIAGYADGIGAAKGLVVPVARDGTLRPPTDLVVRAHRAGLLVHVWTLRSDRQFLPAGYAGDPAREYRQYASLGVDGLFTDFADDARAALEVEPQRP